MHKDDGRSRHELQRQTAARMSVQRIAGPKRIEIKKRHLELDPKTGRLKR